MQWTVRLEARTSAGEVTTTELATFSRPAMVSSLSEIGLVLAETKDHFDWELIGQCAKALDGAAADALREAYDAIEDEEDEHLYHTKGWCRELWLKALGLPAELPPPEEKRDVKSAMEAAAVEKARKRR